MIFRPELWQSRETAAAVAGDAMGTWTATGVSIDSRTVEPGDLFIAIRGAHADGHDHVAQALGHGAVAAMVHRLPPNAPASAKLLVVDDTTDALWALGACGRLRSGAQIVAVTGSVGKTSTKEALRQALGSAGATYASAGNLNNHWGVPLSLARLPAAAAFGVFELGMNRPGEIRPLSRLARPHIAVITRIGQVHSFSFADVAAIADEKAQIMAGMEPDGCVVLNADDVMFPRLLAHARTMGIGRIWSFGQHPMADARLIDCQLHASSSAVSAMIRGELVQYALAAPGRHWVMNSLAVLLVARALDIDPMQAARALGRVQPLKGRGARSRIRLTRDRAQDPLLLIDESYNASPLSMNAALAVLGAADLGDHGRRIAVLGDMLELGEQSTALHLELHHPLKANEVDLVFACGPQMARLYDTLPAAMRGGYAPDSDGLARLVVEAVRPGDAVMVKGSLGSRMAPIVDVLLALDRDEVPAGEILPQRAVQGG